MNRIQKFCSAGDAFWTRHPALFVGSALYIGASIALQFHQLSAYDLALIPLLFLFFYRKRLLWAIALIAISCVTTSFRVHVPTQPGCHQGTLYAEVVDRQPCSFHGRSLWRVRLSIRDFSTPSNPSLLRGVSLSVTMPHPCPILGGRVYRLPARLIIDDQLQPRLHLITSSYGHGADSFSCVEGRCSLRRALERIFTSLFPDPHLRQVAGGLTFGLYKDSLLQKAMHHAGVEHVLAVSGFHFGIVAALTVFLASSATTTVRSIIGMVCLTSYLLVVGPLPSVIRAWTAAMVALSGLCLGRRPSGLNCLGLGCIVSVLYDPSSVIGIGYQLSYLATAAILFFSRPTLDFLRQLVPVRAPVDALLFSKTDQVFLLVLEWVLPALSLLIPVFCLLCPYQLTFLQDFSLLGLVYNLLIPTLFSLAMPAILLAVLCASIPVLPDLFTMIASIPLRAGLFLVEQAPETSWSMVSGGIFPETLGRALILVIVLFGIVYRGKEASDRSDSWKACL